MSLRSDAIAAHEAEQTGRQDEARTALANILTPSTSVAAMTVEDTQVTATSTLIVFTDGDIHLGVRSLGDGWDVHIVAPAGSGVDGWTDLVEVTSLAQLGKVLPDVDPTDENAAPAVPAWTTSVAYKVDDRATYGGFTWKCLQAHTSQVGWEPPNVPALWTKVAA